MCGILSRFGKWSFSLGLSVFALGAYADCGGAPGYGACDNVQITLLYIDANYDAWLSVSGNLANAPCNSNASPNLIQLPHSSANFKEVYATLLAAHISDRMISVRLAPNAPLCAVAYVTMP
jgi:hypothetical protein